MLNIGKTATGMMVSAILRPVIFFLLMIFVHT